MKLDCPICGGEHFKKDCTEKKIIVSYNFKVDAILHLQFFLFFNDLDSIFITIFFS